MTDLIPLEALTDMQLKIAMGAAQLELDKRAGVVRVEMDTVEDPGSTGETLIDWLAEQERSRELKSTVLQAFGPGWRQSCRRVGRPPRGGRGAAAGGVPGRRGRAQLLHRRRVIVRQAGSRSCRLCCASSWSRPALAAAAIA